MWVRYDNTNSDGARMAVGYITESDCLSYCVSLPACVAVDINSVRRPLECWVHTSQNGLARNHGRHGVTHYELTSRCGAATTTTPTTTTTTRHTPSTRQTPSTIGKYSVVTKALDVETESKTEAAYLETEAEAQGSYPIINLIKC